MKHSLRVTRTSNTGEEQQEGKREVEGFSEESHFRHLDTDFRILYYFTWKFVSRGLETSFSIHWSLPEFIFKPHNFLEKIKFLWIKDVVIFFNINLERLPKIKKKIFESMFILSLLFENVELPLFKMSNGFIWNQYYFLVLN